VGSNQIKRSEHKALRKAAFFARENYNQK